MSAAGIGALSVQPPVCPITAAGGTSKHKIVNHCDRRLAYKACLFSRGETTLQVKCSNNSNYTVSTINGFIQIGYDVDIVITRTKGKPQRDRLTILYADVSQEETDPLKAFKNHPASIEGEITGEFVVKLSAAE